METPYTAQASTQGELVRAADEVCPYSRAARGNVDVSLSVTE